jgi:hypothetical protein
MHVYLFTSMPFYISGSFNRHPYMTGACWAALHIQLTCAIRSQHSVQINEIASFCCVRFELNVSSRWVVQQYNNVLLITDHLLQSVVMSAFIQYVPSVNRNYKTMEGSVRSGKDTNYLRCERQSVLQPPAVVYTLIENGEYCFTVTLWWRLQVRLQRRCISTSLHGVLSNNTALHIHSCEDVNYNRLFHAFP